MKNASQLFRTLANISAVLLALGIALPFAFTFLTDGFNFPPVVWDSLQLGGLSGLVLFYLLHRITRPKGTE